MRNLLLVKTSENPEEAIDVSSENMKLLKEESTMLDVETLMRYIRIFSDLSNQIRYATQKRVLVEIALIKLCRPAMETNLDSVLDRLRVLEQRMDERPVQQVIVQQEFREKPAETGAVQEPAGNNSTGESSTGGSAEDRGRLESDHQDRQQGCLNRCFRNLFRSTTVRQENLFFMWNFRIFWGRPMWTIRKREKELQDIITAQTGKTVEIQMLVAISISIPIWQRYHSRPGDTGEYPHGCCDRGRS